MTQKIIKGYKHLVEEARARINELSVEEVKALHGRDDVVIVDLRDVRELEREGRLPDIFHCTRGMLEFWVDPESPYHKDIFAQDKHFIFYCASGMRSVLAADVAQTMGLQPVSHMKGGFKAWSKAGAPVEKHETSSD